MGDRTLRACPWKAANAQRLPDEFDSIDHSLWVDRRRAVADIPAGMQQIMHKADSKANFASKLANNCYVVDLGRFSPGLVGVQGKTHRVINGLAIQLGRFWIFAFFALFRACAIKAGETELKLVIRDASSNFA